MAAASVLRGAPERVDAAADVVVIGAGACGLMAALRARAAGAQVLVVERDATPSGSTAMSSGFVPAPATRFQREIGVADDTPARFAADILAKANGRCDAELATLAAETIGPALEWLADHAGVDWRVLDDFLYPGHSRHRMHCVNERTGAALHARLLATAETMEIAIATQARATQLYADAEDRITAVGIERPGGAREALGCGALVLASSGFGGDPELVKTHIPELGNALYYGHAGNTGDAVRWGDALGAGLAHMSGYQGHGSLAHPHAILISWALMMKGAIQINGDGDRFADESGGYSEQAVKVLAQPGGFAWNVYDETVHRFGLTFPDYRQAHAAGAVRTAPTVGVLAALTGLPQLRLAATLAEVARFCVGAKPDPLGRDFAGLAPLLPPFYAVSVTGALFHTQGGLRIDDRARVVDRQGRPFANLFAGGGAACGVSGPEVSGYLSGNGLLTAIAFGFLAGHEAALTAREPA
ncbi:MAG: FAD-dependent oxidoreductase [Nitratireductor sp.]